MIVKPENLTFADKHFSMILYGSPGVGKSTLALSAPAPVLIDFDKGISRVRAEHRKDTIVCRTHEEVLADVNSPEMAGYETVIIDTGGSFISYLQDWAIRSNPAQNRQKNGALSQKGFGAVKQEFIRFTNYLRDTLNKNVIYIFHSEEQKDRDGNPTQRLMCEGSARNIVWQPCDFGGYVQMIGENRVVSFTPTDEFFAKGCHGISGKRALPNLNPGDRNDFITRLFDEARGNIEAEGELYAEERKKYDAAMAAADEILAAVTDGESATKAIALMQGIEHALTSKRECSVKLNQAATALGLSYDKASGAYVQKAPKEAADA